MNIEVKTPQTRLRELFYRLKQTLRHETTKLNKQSSELTESQRHIWHNQIGDSLLASPESAPRGTTKKSILNIHTQSMDEVTLNPKLNAKQNAELIYKKGRKGRRGYEVTQKKVAETEHNLEIIRNLIERIDSLLKDDYLFNALTDEQLLSLETEAAPLIPENISKKSVKSHAQDTVPFKKFTSDGWEIYLGKNSRQNDELSTRFAKPADIWLHVAAHAGSHVIIRRPKNSPPPPHDVLLKAAALAVWFSKARHTSFAEVHVTEARFVHKRRHAPAGEVIAERCKSLRVEPKDPQVLFPSAKFDDME